MSSQHTADGVTLLCTSPLLCGPKPLDRGDPLSGQHASPGMCNLTDHNEVRVRLHSPGHSGPGVSAGCTLQARSVRCRYEVILRLRKLSLLQSGGHSLQQVETAAGCKARTAEWQIMQTSTRTAALTWCPHEKPYVVAISKAFTPGSASASYSRCTSGSPKLTMADT